MNADEYDGTRLSLCGSICRLLHSVLQTQPLTVCNLITFLKSKSPTGDAVLVPHSESKKE